MSPSCPEQRKRAAHAPARMVHATRPNVTASGDSYRVKVPSHRSYARITGLILGRSGRPFPMFPRVGLGFPVLCGDIVGSTMGSTVDSDLQSGRGRFETLQPRCSPPRTTRAFHGMSSTMAMLEIPWPIATQAPPGEPIATVATPTPHV